MDLYQIFITHNRAWTIREVICFSILFVIAIAVASYLVKQEKIILSQAVAGLCLMLFLGVVFGSTVFTRTPMQRKYELVLFWSWRAIFRNHSVELLKENLLNCILLFPMGVLLPFIFGEKISWNRGFLGGFFVSAVIETSQLVFCRGLFEWDDMVHNAIGCMVGCMMANKIREWMNR